MQISPAIAIDFSAMARASRSVLPVSALAAARALVRQSPLDARAIATEAMKIAGEICIYTNSQVVLEEL